MKSDADQFPIVLRDIARKYRLGAARSRWLRFAFHLTDVRNAAQILRQGKVSCRADLERAGGIPLDIASPRVIARTGHAVKDCVRMYFRPLTPTQYRWEGIRPKEFLWEGSHCPVPIFFLFDLPSILARDDCSFTESNQAKLGFNQLFTTAEELSYFDFGKIFHVDRLSDEEKRDVISHRNAEIIVKKELDLTSLRYVYCRTPAEKETLMRLLTDDLRESWGSSIQVETGSSLFYREWVYVETAVLNETSTTFIFSPDPKLSGPFNLEIECRGQRSETYTQENFHTSGKLQIGFREPIWEYDVELTLDGHLAYAGRFDGGEDIPF